MTSDDGVTWTEQAPSHDGDWWSLTYGNGLFVATSIDIVCYFYSMMGLSCPAPDAHQVMTSPDGITWTDRSTPMHGVFASVAFGNGMFVAPSYSQGASGGSIVSSDGINWTAKDGEAASAWFGIAYGNGVFVAVAQSGGAAVIQTLHWVNTPAAPTAVVATAGDRSASIAFTAGSDAGTAIRKYQYKVDGGAWVDAVGTTSPIRVPLTNYTPHSVRLRAFNGVPSAASEPVSVRPKVAAPVLVGVFSSGEHGIQVSFTGVNPPGAKMMGYTVTAYTKGTSSAVSSCRTPANTRSCYIPGLESGTQYDVRVQGFLTVTGSPIVRETFQSAVRTVRVNGFSLLFNPQKGPVYAPL